MDGNTFTKAERLCSQTAIDWLFDGKGTSFSVFPLRIVYKVLPDGKASAAGNDSPDIPMPLPSPALPQLLISVPKKKLHHAVDRNRIKRLLREAYRKQKRALVAHAAQHHLSVVMAFIYVADRVTTAAEAEASVSSALSRIVTSLQHEPSL